jgi:hypothetical protein
MDYTERHQSGPRCLPWLIKPFVDPQAQFLLVDEKTCLEQSKIVVKLTALFSIDAFVGGPDRCAGCVLVFRRLDR